MKSLTIKNLRTMISRSFAVTAVVLLLMAFLSPDIFEQAVSQHSFHNSPLGIMSSVENIIFGIQTS